MAEFTGTAVVECPCCGEEFETEVTIDVESEGPYAI